MTRGSNVLLPAFFGATTLCLATALLAGCTPAAAPTSSQPQPAPAAASTGSGTSVGQLAPPFAVTTIDGRAVTDADLRAVDKPYILYFYATW